MYARKAVVFWIYFLLVLLTVTFAKRYTADKRVQGSSFQTMMRYGRASTSNSHRDGKIVRIYPRADSFFLGPRYGKRSSWSPNISMVPPTSDEDQDLACFHTGISNLYRCNPKKDATDTANEADV